MDLRESKGPRVEFIPQIKLDDDSESIDVHQKKVKLLALDAKSNGLPAVSVVLAGALPQAPRSDPPQGGIERDITMQNTGGFVMYDNNH